MRPSIYVAGPLTGDVMGGTANACKVGHMIRERGWADYTPHTSVLANWIAPAPEEEWLALCCHWVSKCDALLRLPGHSPGSDRECQQAMDSGIPIVRVQPRAGESLRMATRRALNALAEILCPCTCGKKYDLTDKHWETCPAKEAST